MALTGEQLRAIQSECFYPYQHLAALRCRNRPSFDFEHFRAARFVNDYCFHVGHDLSPNA